MHAHLSPRLVGASAPAPSAALARFHGHDSDVDSDAPEVSFRFLAKLDGEDVAVVAQVGENLLRVAQRYKLPLEGACECSIACSTCHVILEEVVFDSLEEACEDEDDMLDMAWGLEETSRLGCQVKVAENFEGTVVTIPAASRNFYVDGEVPRGSTH